MEFKDFLNELRDCANIKDGEINFPMVALYHDLLDDYRRTIHMQFKKCIHRYGTERFGMDSGYTAKLKGQINDDLYDLFNSMILEVFKKQVEIEKGYSPNSHMDNGNDCCSFHKKDIPKTEMKPSKITKLLSKISDS